MVKITKLASGNYNAKVYAGKDENGKRLYESFTHPDKNIVGYQVSEFKLAMKREKNPDNITLKKAVEDYIADRDNILSPSTIREYKRYAKNYIGDLAQVPVKNIDNQALQRRVNEMAKTVGYKTIKNAMGLFIPAIKAKRPRAEFKLTLPQKKTPKTYCPTERDLLAILSAAYGTELFKAIILAICIGDRRSQVCALEYRDINYQTSTISSTRAVVKDSNGILQTKGPKSDAGSRVVEVPPSLIALLGMGEPTEKVVKIALSTVTKNFGKTIRRLGMPPYRFHDLRHFNASTMLALGIPNKYSQKRGGWATDHVLTSVYQHTLDKKEIEVNQKCNTYFGGLIDQLSPQMQHEKQHKVVNLAQYKEKHA